MYEKISSLIITSQSDWFQIFFFESTLSIFIFSESVIPKYFEEFLQPSSKPGNFQKFYPLIEYI